MQNIQCVMCKHYQGSLTCDAYKGGIPEDILLGLHDHREPYEGDDGIHFELVEVEDLEPIEA